MYWCFIARRLEVVGLFDRLPRTKGERRERKTDYKDWFPRMCEYGFTEGEDFNLLKNEQVRVEGNSLFLTAVYHLVVSRKKAQI